MLTTTQIYELLYVAEEPASHARAVEELVLRPNEAPSVLSMAFQDGNQPPRFERGASGPDHVRLFFSRVHLDDADGEPYIVGPWMAARKAVLANQRAMVGALAAMVDQVELLPLMQWRKQDEPERAKPATPVQEALPKGYDLAEPPCNALARLAAAKEVAVTYVAPYLVGGSPNMPAHRCDVQVEGTIVSTVVVGPKKTAKISVAYLALIELGWLDAVE